MRPDTPSMLHGLRWIDAHQPVGQFPADAPSATIRKRLEAFGLIERCGVEPGRFGFIKFQVTDKGRQLLWENRA